AEMNQALAERPEAVLAFAGWQYINSHGKVLPQQVIPFEGDIASVQHNLNWRNAILPSAAVARLESVRAVGGFNPALPTSEDWDLWVRLSKQGTFLAVSKVLMFYRAHDDSLTENVDSMERARLIVNEAHLGAIEGDPQTWPFDRQRAVGYTYFVTALGHLRN